MKISRTRLKKIIKEELNAILKEGSAAKVAIEIAISTRPFRKSNPGASRLLSQVGHQIEELEKNSLSKDEVPEGYFQGLRSIVKSLENVRENQDTEADLKQAVKEELKKLAQERDLEEGFLGKMFGGGDDENPALEAAKAASKLVGGLDIPYAKVLARIARRAGRVSDDVANSAADKLVSFTGALKRIGRDKADTAATTADEEEREKKLANQAADRRYVARVEREAGITGQQPRVSTGLWGGTKEITSKDLDKRRRAIADRDPRYAKLVRGLPSA